MRTEPQNGRYKGSYSAGLIRSEFEDSESTVLADVGLFGFHQHDTA